MLNPEHNEDHIMSTKTKNTAKDTHANKPGGAVKSIEAERAERMRKRDFRVLTGMVAVVSFATNAAYDIVSELV